MHFLLVRVPGEFLGLEVVLAGRPGLPLQHIGHQLGPPLKIPLAPRRDRFTAADRHPVAPARPVGVEVVPKRSEYLTRVPSGNCSSAESVTLRSVTCGRIRGSRGTTAGSMTARSHCRHRAGARTRGAARYTGRTTGPRVPVRRA